MSTTGLPALRVLMRGILPNRPRSACPAVLPDAPGLKASLRVRSLPLRGGVRPGTDELKHLRPRQGVGVGVDLVVVPAAFAESVLGAGIDVHDAGSCRPVLQRRLQPCEALPPH